MGSIGPEISHLTTSNGVGNSNMIPYEIVEQPSGLPRKIKIIVVGCGASAINFAHEVDTSQLNLDLVCFDKNSSVGGTWFENKYPGCACDIPSVNYQFSWAPSTHWTSFYSGAGEILQYFKGVVDKFGLMKYMRLNSKVTEAVWDEATSNWIVKVQRVDSPDDIIEERADILINASGVLNKWKWPAIPGREIFRGPMLHSANWDDNVKLEGKRVAVIGSGSSAVQIVPNIRPLVSHLTAFIRSQSWVTASFGQRFAGKGGTNFKYDETQKSIMRNDPQKYLAYRKKIESELNSRFRFILNGSPEQAEARKAAEADMRRRLAKKPELADLIIPTNFAVGCRRPTPGAGYLEALCEDNISVVSSSIAEITEKGIKTADGVEHEFDVIVCATGFDVSWKPAYPTIGRDSRDLRQEWAEAPNTYLSITVPHFPNYLIFNGPYGPYGHGSFLPITETLSKHFMMMFTKMSEEGVKIFDVKEEAVADFAKHRKTFLPRTAWSSPCRSWFKGGTVDGEIMMWPGSRIHFFQTMKSPRWEDYNLTHTTNNRFGYLGNGFAAREYDGSDLTWYLGLMGGEDRQPDLPDEDFRDFMVQQE